MLDIFEGWKTGPMHKVLVLRGTPILGDETISTSNNLGIEICGEFWPVIGQTTNAKVTTEGRRRKVNVLLNIFQDAIIKRRTRQKGPTTMVTLTS